MKKIILIMCLGLICICFSVKAFSPMSPSWQYNGGSGAQIVVTYNGSQLVIAPNSYYQPLRVDWFTPSGTQSVAVYGSTFTPYCNCDFRIGGNNAYSFSSSYYTYHP